MRIWAWIGGWPKVTLPWLSLGPMHMAIQVRPLEAWSSASLTLVVWKTSDLHLWPAAPAPEGTVRMKQGHLGRVAGMEATDLMPRAQSQPLQQPADLSPEAQPSAERVNCGHRLPGALFLPTLTPLGGSQAAEGAPSWPSCSWLCYSRQQGRRRRHVREELKINT